MGSSSAMQNAASKVLDPQAGVHAGRARGAGGQRELRAVLGRVVAGRAIAPGRDMPRKRTPKNEQLAFYEFEPLLPSQFYGPQRAGVLQPERRLMLAVF